MARIGRGELGGNLLLEYGLFETFYFNEALREQKGEIFRYSRPKYYAR